MLIIAIHGFWGLKIFTQKPDVWTNSKDLTNDENYDLVKIGYKHIIYERRHGFLYINSGVKRTLKKLRKKIIKENGNVAIIGHSLGGWAANLLTHYLINGYDNVPGLPDNINIKLLVQIDSLLVKLNSPIYKNDGWHLGLKLSKDGHIVLSTDSKYKIPQKLITFVKLIADPLDSSQIDTLYQKNQNIDPDVIHQQQFGNRLLNHWNFYCEANSKDESNVIVEDATGVKTGDIIGFPIFDPNITQDNYNRSLNLSHENIDKSDEIYQSIRELLLNV